MKSRMCMSGIAAGLMVLLLMNCSHARQNKDGVCSIVHAAILNVPTQTQQEDVHSPSLTEPSGLEPIRYRLVQDITMPLHIRNAVSAVPDSNA